MAGHSKWANIQHRKNNQDHKRSKLFTRLIREITVSAREGGATVSTNPRLRLAIDKAMQANMSKEAIERAILRGSGQLNDDEVIESRYEAYGSGGVGIVIECLTDNRNRTVADIRLVLNKHGGHLANEGSVVYLFEKYGILECQINLSEDRILEVALALNAEETLIFAEHWRLLFVANQWATVLIQLETAEFKDFNDKVLSRRLGWHPNSLLEVDSACRAQLKQLILKLEELDDVQEIYYNSQSLG